MLPVKDTPELAADMLPETPPQRQPNVRETILYLPEQTHRYRFPAYIPWETGIAKAEYIVQRAVCCRKLLLTLPPRHGELVLGLLREGVARVDFSKEFLNYPVEQEQQIINDLFIL